MLSRPFNLSAGEAHVSASVGVAIYPENGQSLAELVASADAALYAAKEGGRNTYRMLAAGSAFSAK